MYFIINILFLILEKDAVAAIITFLVCVIFGVELGLLIGAVFSLIFFLRPSVRPKIEVIQCKVKNSSLLLYVCDTNINKIFTYYTCE